MKKINFLVGICIFSAAFSLAAQSNTIIDTFLNEKVATYGNAAYLVLNASSRLKDEATVNDAVEYIKKNDWRWRKKKPIIHKKSETITLGQFCFLITKSWNYKGGLMHRIFPGVRYSARELHYLGCFKGSFAADRKISGEDALKILGNFIEIMEEKQKKENNGENES